MKKRNVVLSALLFAIGVAGSARAQGFYMGAGLGQSTGDRHGDFDPLSAPATIRQKDSTWTAFGGYRFYADRLALEAGYADLGTQKHPGTYACEYARDETARGYYLRANGRLPLFAGLSLTAHAGAARATYSLRAYPSTNFDARVVCITTIRNFTVPEDDTDLLWGLGAAWDLGDRWRLRGEWSRYELGNGLNESRQHKLAAYQVALVFKF